MADVNSMPNSMKGKTAIVTGGGTGLGAATAIGLAKRGVNVCINYNSSADAAEQVVAECKKLGVDAFAMKANVAEDADCRALAEAAAKKFGGIDVLVNNAGITKFANHNDLEALDAGLHRRHAAVGRICDEASAGLAIHTHSRPEDRPLVGLSCLLVCEE